MDNVKMGRFIAEQRKARGMTQMELAKKLHITDKAVSKWERGLSSPDIGLLSDLADALEVSVTDLLRGERTDETAGDAGPGVREVLHYAETSVRKKYSVIRLAVSLGFTALLLTGILVCAIVDASMTGRLTWSLYPIASCVFAWCVLFPVLLLGRKGIRSSAIVLTFLIVPYLFVLDKLAVAEGLILKAGALVSVTALAYLWAVLFLMRRFWSRKLLGAGVATLLAVPVCFLINYSLSLTLTPEAGALDVWDALNTATLVITGLSLIGADLAMRGRKQPAK